MDEPRELSAWTFRLPWAGKDGPRVTVIGLPEGHSDKKWMKHVVAAEKDIRTQKSIRTLFFQPTANGFRVTMQAPERPRADELKGVAAVLAHQGLAAGHGTVDLQVGNKVKRVAVPSPSIDLGEGYPVLTASGLREHLSGHNDRVLGRLEAQLRSPLGVIPFVGAGMSAGFGLPQWGAFLNQLATATTVRGRIAELIGNGKYEEAAELLEQRLGPDEFQFRIADAFEREPDPAKLVSGNPSYLPFLTRGPVLTTNFDRVLEGVFAAAGRGFDEVIAGRFPDKTVTAIHRNQRKLIKLHGTAGDRTFRVFTKPEYEEGYTGGLTSMAWLTFTNRPLLFLGCSLEHDRTVDVLKTIDGVLPGLQHYAVLEAHHSFLRREEREQQLGGMGITPLWFPPKDFPQIGRLLGDLILRSSTRLLPVLDPPPPPPAPVVETPEVGVARFADAAGAGGPPDGAEDDGLGPTLDLVARAAVEGRLAFFLGAYASLGTQPLGNEFYKLLADQFGAPADPGDDRAASAAFVLTRQGRQVLFQGIQEILAGPGRQAAPGPVYRVLAAIPGLLRAQQRAGSAPLWVLTTNYDTLMEDALAEAGEPYHLLYYMGGLVAEHEGLFAVRSPDGTARVIEQPDNYRWLDGAHSVVVKLNGGLLRDRRIEPSLAVARGHFERLAARIPEALPAVVRRALRERSLLFLGHGLREADVNAIIREAAPHDGTVKSWAVLRPPPERSDPRQQFEEWVGYIGQFGLRVIRSDLERFVRRLHQELLWRPF